MNADATRAVPVVIVHGGAGRIPRDIREDSKDGVKLAARRAYEILKTGGSALDAVEAATVLLENDPTFNAGKGSFLNEAGEIDMDASIMDGTSLKAGAVAAVDCVANPVSLARLVLERTDHCLLVGKGAHQFALECGLQTIDPSSLIIERTWEDWRDYRRRRKSSTDKASASLNGSKVVVGNDTVGAVALDVNGRMAAATSTGGTGGKRIGRVADCPLIGCGTYSCDEVGAASCSGHGESMIRVCLAKHIISLMESGLGAQTAVEKGLKWMQTRVKGTGGCVTLSSEGDVGIYFTTKRMAWAMAKDDVLSWGLNPNDRYQVEL